MRASSPYLMALLVVAAACGDSRSNQTAPTLHGGGENLRDGTRSLCDASGGAGCESTQAFRISAMSLLGPGVHARGQCGSERSLTRKLNDNLALRLNEDRRSRVGAPDSEDGLIDLGLVITLRSLHPDDDAPRYGAIALADCNRLGRPSPSPNPTPCSPSLFSAGASFAVRTQSRGECLGPVNGTVEDARVVEPVAADPERCWVSAPFDLLLAPDEAPFIAIKEAQIAAKSTANGSLQGLIRGFVHLRDAEVDTIPGDTPIVGGQTLAETLGAKGVCDSRDLDHGQGGADGFWVYLAFEAERVPWRGGPLCGNGVLDANRPEGPEICDPGDLDGLENCAALFECEDRSDGATTILNLGDPCAPRCFRPSD